MGFDVRSRAACSAPRQSDAAVPYVKSLWPPHVQPVERSSKEDHALRARTTVYPGFDLFINNLRATNSNPASGFQDQTDPVCLELRGGTTLLQAKNGPKSKPPKSVWARLAFSGGGELDKDKTADLMETLTEPSRMRGNDPNALQNPCRPTVIISDTAKIRGRIEYPHWEPPRYFLRPREKAKEIGPDVQYADRNDMQRIFSAVVKNSLFDWGEYEEQGAERAPTCRRENPEKWMGDQPFHPGFRFRDNQRESMAGIKFPPDLLNAGDYKRQAEFSRDRHPSKELTQHERFRLVVKNGEYACPEGKTRRSLRFEEEPPEPYPTEKMYFASLRSVPINPATENLRAAGSNRERDLLRKTRSVGSLQGRLGAGGETTRGNPCTGADYAQSRGGMSQTKGGCGPGGGLPLSISRSSTAVRFSGHQAGGSESDEDHERLNVATWAGEGALVEVGGAAASVEAAAATGRGGGCDEKVAGQMRRGSEMASWAICGTKQKSARDYLW